MVHPMMQIAAYKDNQPLLSLLFGVYILCAFLIVIVLGYLIPYLIKRANNDLSADLYEFECRLSIWHFALSGFAISLLVGVLILPALVSRKLGFPSKLLIASLPVALLCMRFIEYYLFKNKCYVKVQKGAIEFNCQLYIISPPFKAKIDFSEVSSIDHKGRCYIFNFKDGFPVKIYDDMLIAFAGYNKILEVIQSFDSNRLPASG